MQQNEGLLVDEDDLEFIVRLCHDVLLEALLFGDRRRLTKLERVGRRFHRIIEDFLQHAPFLRLDLILDPEYYYIYLIFHCLKLWKKVQNSIANV